MQAYRSLLVGLDLTPDGNDITPASRKAATQARWLAEHTGAALTFLHSTWTDFHTEEHPAPPGGARALEALLDATTKSGIEAELVYEEERPWLAIIRRVLSSSNDLVFVARRSNHPSGLGSVTKELLRKCPSPVWAVNPDHDLVLRLVTVATDLSPVGDRATELAAYVARAHDADLHVLHAWQRPMTLQLEAARLSRDEVRAREGEIEEAALAHIHATLTSAGVGERVAVHVRCDSPVGFITGEVESHDPDLIVLGTVSRGGIPGLLLGNTSEKLLDRLQCSLLAIKPDDFVCPVE